MNEENLLGPMMEPPRGGPERLRRAITHDRRVPAFHVRYWIAVGSAISMAALVAVAVLVWGGGAAHEEQIHEAVQQALAPPPKTYFKNAGYKEIQTGDSSVRILVVASLKKDDQ